MEPRGEGTVACSTTAGDRPSCPSGIGAVCCAKARRDIGEPRPCGVFRVVERVRLGGQDRSSAIGLPSVGTVTSGRQSVAQKGVQSLRAVFRERYRPVHRFRRGLLDGLHAALADREAQHVEQLSEIARIGRVMRERPHRPEPLPGRRIPMESVNVRHTSRLIAPTDERQRRTASRSPGWSSRVRDLGPSNPPHVLVSDTSTPPRPRTW